MARTDPQINIRVAADLKKKLELLAIENGRSLNAEVVSRLEKSLELDSYGDSIDPVRLKLDLEEIKKIVDEINKKAP